MKTMRKLQWGRRPCVVILDGKIDSDKLSCKGSIGGSCQLVGGSAAKLMKLDCIYCIYYYTGSVNLVKPNLIPVNFA